MFPDVSLEYWLSDFELPPLRQVQRPLSQLQHSYSRTVCTVWCNSLSKNRRKNAPYYANTPLCAGVRGSRLFIWYYHARTIDRWFSAAAPLITCAVLSAENKRQKEGSWLLSQTHSSLSLSRVCGIFAKEHNSSTHIETWYPHSEQAHKQHMHTNTICIYIYNTYYNFTYGAIKWAYFVDVSRRRVRAAPGYVSRETRVNPTPMFPSSFRPGSVIAAPHQSTLLNSSTNRNNTTQTDRSWVYQKRLRAHKMRASVQTCTRIREEVIL